MKFIFIILLSINLFAHSVVFNRFNTQETLIKNGIKTCDEGFYFNNKKCVFDPCYDNPSISNDGCGENSSCLLISDSKTDIDKKICQCDSGYIRNGLILNEKCVFDWRKEYLPLLDAKNPMMKLNAPIRNLFASNGLALDDFDCYSSSSDKLCPYDFLPEEGWVLLYYDKTSNPNAIISKKIVMYNRFTGIMRVFINSSIRYFWGTIELTQIVNSDKKNSILRNQKGLSYALDYSNLDKIKGQTAILNHFNSNDYWNYADFYIDYSPFINKKDSTSYFNILIQGWSRAIPSDFNDNHYRNSRLNITSQNDILGKKIITKYLAPLIYTEASIETLISRVYNKMDRYFDENSVFKKFLKEIDKNSTDFYKLISKNSIYIGVATSFLKFFLGNNENSIFSIIDSTEEIELQRDPKPIIPNGGNFIFTVPFSKTVTSLTSELPIYDKPLGLLSLNSSPTIVVNKIFSENLNNGNKSNEYLIYIPKQKIDLEFNNYSGVFLEKIYVAVTFEAKCEKILSQVNIIDVIDSENNICLYQSKYVPYDVLNSSNRYIFVGMIHNSSPSNIKMKMVSIINGVRRFKPTIFVQNYYPKIVELYTDNPTPYSMTCHFVESNFNEFTSSDEMLQSLNPDDYIEDIDTHSKIDTIGNIFFQPSLFRIERVKNQFFKNESFKMVFESYHESSISIQSLYPSGLIKTHSITSKPFVEESSIQNITTEDIKDLSNEMFLDVDSNFAKSHYINMKFSEIGEYTIYINYTENGVQKLKIERITISE
ncbi:hypothetical protein JXR93_11165 [bacterium]|nr:hypothetical protein [bacterium]